MKASTLSAAFAAIMLAALLGMPAVVTAQTPAGDTLIVGVQNDTPNLHPWDQATNSVWKSFLWRQWVFEGLYGLSPDGSIYPVLATSYTVDPSGLNITVNLRTGVTFTDGQPLTADDVVFTFQIMGFNSQLSDTILKSITWPDPPQWDWWNSTTAWGSTHKTHVGIEKVSATQVIFHVRKPYSMFFFGTMTTPIMPMHIWQNHLVEVDLSVFSLPDGSPIVQGTEFDFDRNFGATSADVTATIGTGPWYLDHWTPGSTAVIRVYDGYWGKSQSLTWQGKQWPFFPRTIKTMEFRIYGTLDVAILALKSGEVHIVPWNLPIGFYNDLRQDPNMGFKIPTSDGFFYIAFNMRKAPFNDLNFRKAVSLAVDKDFIVDRLLGGFGIKGQIPVSPINPAYINSSAVAPPFDLAQARSVLDAAGYIDSNGDGWRELPGGAPLKYSILTPAKDYDPTRADAGIMISNNLKSIGLNIDSSPTAFDAIVSAVFVAVQFDMYILGWVSLGPFPELYLFEFFGCASDVTLGVGSNTPGFCNAEFEAKMNILDTEMNDAVRIQAAKDAEGILARELPYDTLYNTRQIEAYRADIWKGWTDVNGEIFNGFSIGILGASSVSAPTGPLTISLNTPGTGVAGSTTHFQAYAVQDGLPASSVAVTVTATSGESASGTTNAQGYADIAFTLPALDVPDTLGLLAVGTKGTFTGGDTSYIRVVPPNDIAQLLLSTPTPVVAPGGVATITATVTDKTGAAIAGAPVEIIPELVLGSVVPSNASTNSAGIATFTYTAPAATLIPNKNQYDFIKASVFAPNKLVLPETKSQTLVMGVQNSAYDWYLVDIQTVSSYIVQIPPAPVTSDVTVKVTKQDGTVVVGEPVTAAVSNSTALLVDAATKPTGPLGMVTFTFSANTDVAQPVAVDFTVEQPSFALAGLSLYVTNATATGNATITRAVPRFADPNSAIDVTVNVYDQTGAPENGATVDIFVPYNEVGNPISAPGTGWTFMANVGTAFEGTTDATGTLTTSFNMKSFPADNIVTLETGVFGYGPRGSFILGSPAKTYSNLEVVQKRNVLVAVQSWAMSPIILNSATRVANVSAIFKDISGPVTGLNVSVYRGKGDLRPGKGATKIDYFLTDSTGLIRAQWTEPMREIDTGLSFTAVVTSSSYALGGVVGGAPFEVYFPYLMPPGILVPSGSPPPTTTVRVGDRQTYNILVNDFSGNPVQDVVVRARIAGNVSGKTDGTGHISLSLAPGTSSPTQTDAWEQIFDLTKGGVQTTLQLGTLVGVGVFHVYGLQVPGSGSVGKAATISVTVNNSGPVGDLALVTLKDGDTVIAQKQVMVPVGPATVTVEFTYVPYDTAAHTLTVSVGTESVQGSLTAGGAGIDMAVAAGLAIVLLIVGIIIGFLFGKRPKAPKPEEKPAEEPEEQPKP